MIKFEKIKPGMTLYDVRRATGLVRTMGGKWSTYPVYVRSVNAKNRTVVASWNGNRDTLMFENQVTRYRAKQPKRK